MGKLRQKFLVVFISNCREFCRNSQIHGLNHLIHPRRSFLEKLFWFVTVSVAIGLGTELIYRSYMRYENNPVVVSISKNYFSWNITFPGSTWCFLDRLDEEKALDYIKRKWNTSEGKQLEEYMDFLNILANSNYGTLKSFKRFTDNANFKGLDLQTVMNEVTFKYYNYSTVTYFGDSLSYQEVLTEEGICYTSSMVAPFISTSAAVRANPGNLEEIVICTFFQLPCFVRLLNIPRPLKYYVHSAYEIPDSRSKYWPVQKELGIDTYFSFLNREAHSSLKDLRLQQRKCNLREETFPSSESPFYSLTLCEMNCRRKLCMELCKCVPHFYIKRADQQTCNVEGLVCLSKYTDYIVTLGAKNDSEKYPCECYPSCSETEFILENPVFVTLKEFFISGMRFSWYIDIFPKIAVRRHVIFGFEGLLVNLGGIAGFFTGSSILSIIEVVYFFTIRLIKHLLKEFAARTKIPKKQNKKTVRFVNQPGPILVTRPYKDFQF